MRRLLIGGALVLALAGAAVHPAAQFSIGPRGSTRGAAVAQERPGVPPAEALRLLVTTIVVGLNQANATGNYTVLRDLGSPAFQQANTAAKLSSIFQKLREQNLDLSPVILHEPRFTRPPVVDQQGFLRLTGNYPTRPLQVNFDLSFQPVEGHWRLFAISIGTTTEIGAAAPAPAPPGAPARPSAQGVRPASPAQPPK